MKLSGQKPIIDFYLTGGTISSKLDSETGGVKWLINAHELFKIYPEIFEIANVSKVEVPFMKASEDMDYKDWQKIKESVLKIISTIKKNWENKTENNNKGYFG